MAGIGTTVKAGPGYSVGVRYYPLSLDRTWRPRISFVYGTTAVLVIDDGPESSESIAGTSVGLGFLTTNRRRTGGWEFDLLYILDHSDLDERTEELEQMGYTITSEKTLGDFKIALGYRFLF